MSDTPTPERARNDTGPGLSLSGHVTISRRTLIGLVTALAGLGGAGLYTGVRADASADEAKQLGEHGAEVAKTAKREAQTAKVEASAGYQATREKLDATATVAAGAATACATRAELEAVQRRIDELPLVGGRRRPRARRVPAAVVPPEVKAPLPPTPAAAAAEAAPPPAAGAAKEKP